VDEVDSGGEEEREIRARARRTRLVPSLSFPTEAVLIASELLQTRGMGLVRRRVAGGGGESELR
jgi:hypothetical protein